LSSTFVGKSNFLSFPFPTSNFSSLFKRDQARRSQHSVNWRTKSPFFFWAYSKVGLLYSESNFCSFLSTCFFSLLFQSFRTSFLLYLLQSTIFREPSLKNLYQLSIYL
jgi:hypothetical protein